VQREHFQIRGRTEVGWENWRFSTDKSSYLRNGERELRLLLITNRKSHKAFQMTRKSSTSDDLEGSIRTRQFSLLHFCSTQNLKMFPLH